MKMHQLLLLCLCCLQGNAAFITAPDKHRYSAGTFERHERSPTCRSMTAASDETATTNEKFVLSTPITSSSNHTTQMDEALTPLPQFGQVVQLRRPSTVSTSAAAASTTFGIREPSATEATSSDSNSSIQSMLRRNALVAVASVVFAVSNYAWHYTHPLSSLQLLASMQARSPPLSIIGTNQKPTLVQFWAPWCKNCKEEAPTMFMIQQEFGDRVNFVLVNGDLSDSYTYKAIETFGVDAIPHIALVDANGSVETALIGMIPKHVLEQDLQVLVQRADSNDASTITQTELPYTMMDAFANRPNERRVHFDE
ncbi:hypothetical protein MPSEU_000557100 [Mayamaea pseudoterrestris]|nr:hypothetical protein MPSEU_000557100 [Mayamaea pseudoterrestris]